MQNVLCNRSEYLKLYNDASFALFQIKFVYDICKSYLQFEAMSYVGTLI